MKNILARAAMTDEADARYAEHLQRVKGITDKEAIMASMSRYLRELAEINIEIERWRDFCRDELHRTTRLGEIPPDRNAGAFWDAPNDSANPSHTAIILPFQKGTSRSKTPKFKLQSLSEFAGGDFEDDYIDDVLPNAPFGVIMGQSGSGKTFAVLDMVLALERGVRWRDRDTERLHCVYVAAEGAGGVRKRVIAYAKHHDLNLANIGTTILPASPNLLLKDDVQELARVIKFGKHADLIVFDTWSQMTPGADENSSKDMGKALENAKYVQGKTGANANILIVAHVGKDAAKGMRGWSGFKAAMDYEIEVESGCQKSSPTRAESYQIEGRSRWHTVCVPPTCGGYRLYEAE